MIISLLLPTRKRPDQFKRFFESAINNANNPDNVFFSVYIDDDDNETKDVISELNYEYRRNQNIIKYKIGPRIVLSQMWNEAYSNAVESDIYGHMGDDIIFQTQGWDTKVKNAFREIPDKVAFVHGNDGFWEGKLGTHGFLHKNWINTVGYFVPPYFSSDYNDTWLTEVADRIDRHIYLPDLLTEHMHWTFGKGPKDQTHIDRIERHKKDNVKALYDSKQTERDSDVKKLQEFIDNFAREGEMLGE